jgi:hypothetical protein
MVVILGAAFNVRAQTGVPDSLNGVAAPVENGMVALTGTNMASLFSWSNDQLTTLVNVLDTTPTIPTTALPGAGRGGTFWSLQRPNFPPLPGDTIGVVGSHRLELECLGKSGCQSDMEYFNK